MMSQILSCIGIIKSPTIIDQFQKIKTLGAGSQATVYLFKKRKYMPSHYEAENISHNSDKDFYAIKVFTIDSKEAEE